MARPDARPALVAPKPAGLDLDTPSPVGYRSIIGQAPASLRPWLRLQSVYNGSLTLESGTAFGLPRWYRGFVGTPRFDPALTQAHSLSLRSTETSYSPLTHCRWPPSCDARETLGHCGFRCAATTAPVPVPDFRFPFGWDQKMPGPISAKYPIKLSFVITFV